MKVAPVVQKVVAQMGFDSRFAGTMTVALVVAGWASPAASQDMGGEPSGNEPKVASAERAYFAGASWYGYQTFAPDALALTVFLADGNVRASAAAGWTVAGLYLLGAPTAHALHRRPGAVAGSLALRLVVPLLSAGVGGALPCHQSFPSDESCSLGGTIWGFGVGMGLAAIVDAALVAWGRPSAAAAPITRATSTSAGSVSLSPLPLREGAGLLVAGLF